MDKWYAWISKQQGVRQLKPLSMPEKNIIYKLGKDRIIVFFPLPDKIGLMIILKPFEDGWQAGIYSLPEFRGKQVGARAYSAISKQLRKPIYSDSSQTSASRYGVWYKLIDMVPDRVAVYDQQEGHDIPWSMATGGPMAWGDQPVYVNKEWSLQRMLADPATFRTRLLKLYPSDRPF